MANEKLNNIDQKYTWDFIVELSSSHNPPNYPAWMGSFSGMFSHLLGITSIREIWLDWCADAAMKRLHYYSYPLN